MSTPVPVDVRELMRAIEAVPADHLEYDVPVDRVFPHFGVDPPTLAAWRTAGLRHRTGADGEDAFSSTDLHYVSLRTGQGGVFRRTLESWTAAARESLTASGGHRISYFIQAAPGVPDGALVDVLTPSGTIQAPYRPRTVIASYDVAHQPAAATPAAATHALLSRIAGLQLVFVPDTLRGSREFLRATGFVDCEDAAGELLELCRERGVEARGVYGLVAGRPLATPHSCVELRDGDGWLVVSPLLISTMHRFGGLDETEFPAWSALGSMYVPLAATPTPLVRYRDIDIPVSVLVSAHT
jgi:hypothetical protein